MKRPTEKFFSFFDKISGIALLFVMVMTIVSVVVRKFFKPLVGIDEYTSFIMTIITGFALGNCAIKDAHISVDMIVERFSPKVRAVIDSITGAISLVFFSFTIWHIGKYAYSVYIGGEMSMTTLTPTYPFIYAVAFGMIGLVIAIFIRLLDSFGKVVKQ